MEERIETVINVCLDIEAEFVKERVNRVVGIVADDEAEEESVVCSSIEAVDND